ncbi:MAG: 2,3-bisphosphoglycerate-independent phosphoglycerate mutase [Chloroflexi bacterium]|nr:2,3-bisphosphoglycerate-independent phosphoglycerate mutase [Chloroflexota bacterium]
MADLTLMHELAIPGTSKMVMLILDGLGGLPMYFGGGTELETARTPHLDALAGGSTCGLMESIGAGITPGSGPAHVSLFGYDPLQFQIGRGVLEALGIDFHLGPNDLAARGNFATVDEAGLITDRRAGRIPTETCVALCDRLRSIKLPGAEVFVEPVKEHRFVLVLRAEGLDQAISETDPQKLGHAPLPAHALNPQAERAAALVNEFVTQARKLLQDQHPANALLLRGFAKHPALPTMNETYGIRPAAIATYPMYKGLARLVGMDLLQTGDAIEDQFTCLEQHWADYDFFFIHIKHTDSRGEDGNFDAKVAVIERVDRQIPRLMQLNPDVVIVTGDHSTPAVLAGHSWHPLPFLLYSHYCRPDRLEAFGEFQCGRYGSLGTLTAVNVLPLMMANALRLTKFGA